jgi:hypothetical protein
MLALEMTMTTVGDITYHESLLTEERERRAKLEDQVKTAADTVALALARGARTAKAGRGHTI